MTRRTKARNRGLGRTLGYAGKSALKKLFGSGHYGTRHSHGARWSSSARWLRVTYGVRDAREIRQTMIEAYVAHLRSSVDAGRISTATAINRVSTVNRILPALVGHNRWHVEPSKSLGLRRTHIRIRPAKDDGLAVSKVVESLRGRNHVHAAMIVLLIFYFGLRVREACLFRVHTALQQAEAHGRIWVTEGTKGGTGKHQERSVPVDVNGIGILREAVSIAGSNANLIPQRWPDRQLKKFLSHIYGVVSPRLKAVGIKDQRDLRAVYGCRRYEQLTGNPAPVNLMDDLEPTDTDNGELKASDAERPGTLLSDAEARTVIARELGHRRKQVVASYVGKSR